MTRFVLVPSRAPDGDRDVTVHREGRVIARYTLHRDSLRWVTGADMFYVIARANRELASTDIGNVGAALRNNGDWSTSV